MVTVQNNSQFFQPMKTDSEFSSISFGSLLKLLMCAAFTPCVVAQQTSVLPTMSLNGGDLGSWNCNWTAAEFQPTAGANQYTWDLISSRAFSFGGGSTTMTVNEIKFDTDPLIYGNILVQNNTPANQTYTLVFSIPTIWGAPSFIRGSIDTSLIGANATVSALASSSIYSAQIDGATVETLQDNPFSLSTPANAISSGASFGYDVNLIPVTSSIGIQLRFELSPGDTVAIISDFEIVSEVVPEPGSLALVLLGGGAMILRRQRK
jgi:hypothetical protein